MKHLILYTVLMGFALESQEQGDSRQLLLTTTSQTNDPWDLNKYIWSHTHSTSLKADKPLLDFDALEKWTELGPDLSISSNGAFFSYSIHNTETNRRDSLVVQSTKYSWRRTLPYASPGFFSADSKQYIYQDKNELCFLLTGKEEIRKIKDIASFQQPSLNKGKWLACQVKNKDATLVLLDLLTRTEKRFDNVSDYCFDQRGQWLAYQLNNEIKELVVYHLATDKEIHFPGTVDFLFDANGEVLIMKNMEKSGHRIITTLQYVSLVDKTTHVLWKTTDSTTVINSYSLDGTGKQVSFVLQNNIASTGISSTQSDFSIWYWRTGIDKATLKVNNQTTGIEDDLLVDGSVIFSDNNRYIIFNLHHKASDPGKTNPDAVNVDIWSYKDTILQSTQPYLLKSPLPTYSAAISIEGTEVIRLNKDHESLGSLQGDFAVIEKSIRKINGDRFWENNYYNDSIWLLSLKTGLRRFIGQMPEQDRHTRLSPGGKYLVYFDASRQCHYYSIELSTGKLASISATVPALQLGLVNYYLLPREKPKYSAGLLGWLEGDSGLLVYDQYGDIWHLDLAGKKLPANITNGYGQSQHIQFKLLGYKNDLSGTPILKAKDTLLLTAFNTINKQQGFYRKILGQTANPELLYIGPCKLDIPVNVSDSKAIDSNVWIVKRESATEAPNYFLTTDFKFFKPLTDLQPQKKYNWLTAELHAFKQPDGTASQGILYKPENFDSTKKYPTLIVFYGTLTNQLYQYPKAEFISSPSSSKDSPSWMVSHGYLVFTPDIYFTKGKWGPSALNAVEGAAKYLSSLPFVDDKHLGACGHSNSGRTAYYVLSHSQSFAAMSVGASQSNIISAALSLEKATENEQSYLEWIENGTFGTSLGNIWENKSAWIDHSAVLNADKVASPVLLFHNKKDGHPLAQVIEMYISLRRLEKKAWWLQYDEGYHTLRKEKDLKDFTIRYTQFFDHYLKDAPAPYWMTQGIPYRLKGIENGYKLDAGGYCSKDCLICKARSKSNNKNEY